MDPDACLSKILDDLTDLHKSSAPLSRIHVVEGLRNLSDWIDQGGYAPNVLKVLDIKDDSWDDDIWK